jgi:LCP family protein required for cell wall assembly
VLGTIAAVLAVILVGTAGYAWYSYQHLTSSITHINAIKTPASGAPKAENSDENILLIGDDHRPANASPQLLAELGTQQDGGGVNTDTMMVLHIPASGGKATIISFPRDSWVQIPGYGSNKLNAAFELGAQNGGGDKGGVQLLITTIQNMTGLHIDHFVRVSLLGFYTIAKALGPVQVCLNHAVDDPYSTLQLPAGVSTLDAHEALAFVRQRHGLPNGDLDREKRQQYFLSVELRKVLQAGTLLNPVKLQNVIGAVGSSLETDPGLNLLALAQRMHDFSASNLTTATIPILGTPTIYAHGAPVSIVEVDTAAMPGFIAQVIGQPTAYMKAHAAAPASVAVTVLNGSGTARAATEATATLTGLHFNTLAPGNATLRSKTTIEYPAGKESGAKALAKYVPSADVVASSTVDKVTLVLGSDGVRPTDPAAAAKGASTAPATAAATPTSTPTPAAKSFGAHECVN